MTPSVGMVNRANAKGTVDFGSISKSGQTKSFKLGLLLAAEGEKGQSDFLHHKGVGK